MQASSVPARARHTPRIVASLFLLALLAGCGYKGPLYMPPPATNASLAKPPQSVQLPAAGSADDSAATPAQSHAVK
jgi:predicted small lipoprotein YifL